MSMSKYAKYSKVAKNGSVDSKYFGNPDQFEKDIQAKIDKADKFKQDIKDLILSNPSDIEKNYHYAIEVLLEIKEEFKI